MARLDEIDGPRLADVAQTGESDFRHNPFTSSQLWSGSRCKSNTFKGWIRHFTGFLEQAVSSLNRLGFPNRHCSDSTCWLGGGQQGWPVHIRKTCDRVIDAVVRGGMSRRAAAARFGVSESSAIKWVQRFERSGSRAASKMGGYLRPRLEPHREFLEALRAEKSDITLKALCDRLLAERGVKADTSMMSRFFRRIGVTLKKRRLSRASRIVRT